MPAANQGRDDRQHARRSRILLLVQNPGNRRQLTAQLEQSYRVVQPRGNELPAEGFDLALIDGPALRHWQGRLTDAKNAEQPVMLPVMLVLAHPELRRRTGTLWRLVDDFIVAPIERTELLERVAILLRARHLATQQQKQLAHFVNHDTTTGLPNQNLFLDRLQTAINNAGAGAGAGFYVTVIHVPLIKVVNPLGQEALNHAANRYTARFQTLVDTTYTLARLATEQWAVLSPTQVSIEHVSGLCRRINDVVRQPLAIAGERVRMACSMGVSVYPDDAATATGLLNAASTAATQGRAGGTTTFYSADAQKHSLHYIRTEDAMHQALERNEFELWYQPQYRLECMGVVGAEGLIRWRKPSGELVPPGDFLPVAESSGLIREIDYWVIDTACATLARWNTGRPGALRVAVNITPMDIAAPDFVSWVQDRIRFHGIRSCSLELELTETMFYDANRGTLDKLDELRALGITVAIDDFGTGYSSLRYLHKLPVNTLKIDKSFIDNITSDDTSSSITRVIIELGRQFGLEMVAEGIEHPEQLELLRKLGVTTGQGFFLGRPMPEADFLRHLQHDPVRKSRARNAC